jgi:hypothetical protein
MQSESGNVHLLNAVCGIEARKDDGNLGDLVRRQSAPIIVLIEPPQPSMAKADNHHNDV